MKKLLFVVMMCGFVLNVAPKAEAIFIVDTGTPTGNSTWSVFNSTSTSGLFQFTAGQFTTTDDYVINSLEGYFASFTANNAGPIDAVLYFDNAGSVDMVGEIFRQTFSVPTTIDPDEIWTGVHGINYNLMAGTYWLAFEAQDGAFFTTMRDGAPNPLDNYAFNNSAAGYTNSALNFGVRIDAQDAPGNTVVPEPMSMVLFGAGMIGAAVRRKLSV